MQTKKKKVYIKSKKKVAHSSVHIFAYTDYVLLCWASRIIKLN